MGYFRLFMSLTILIMALFFLLNHSVQIFNLQFGTFLKVHQQKKKEGLYSVASFINVPIFVSLVTSYLSS